MRFLQASLHGLLDALAEQPIPIFFGLLLGYNRNVETTCLFICAILFTILSAYIRIFRHNINITAQLLNLLDQFKSKQITLTPLDEIISHFDDVDDIKACILQEGMDSNLGYLCTIETESHKAGVVTQTAFPRVGPPSIVVATEDPRCCKSGAFAKFKFFHELGHLSHAQFLIETALFSACWKASFLLLAIILFSRQSPLIQLFGFIGNLVWIGSYIRLHLSYKKLNVTESIADGFAICRFREQNDFGVIDRLFNQAKRNPQQMRSFDWFKNWAKDPVDLLNDPESGIFVRRLPEKFTRLHLGKRTVNFKSAAEAYYRPKFIVNFLFLAGLISITYHVDITSTTAVYVMAAVLILIPTILYIYLRSLFGLMESELVKRLNGDWDNCKKSFWNDSAYAGSN